MKKRVKKIKEDSIDVLFEKLVLEKEKGIKHIENVKKDITKKLDQEIDNLYKKRDFIAEVFADRKKLMKQKLGVWKKIRKTKKVMLLRYLISMPFIYMMIIPVIPMHIMLEIYHQVAFRLYDIPRVRMKDYFIFDRRHLPYLNWLEKINCAYCSYYNAFAAYLKEIVARTERYWCPIKHSMKMQESHSQYSHFIDFNDAKALRSQWEKLREFEEYKEK